MRPCVGLMAARPQCAAGRRTLPAMSVPRPNAPRPHASDAPTPALDPPGSAAIAAKLSAASGYEVQNVPPESSNAGYKDWFLARFHRPGFTIEAGLGENPLELSQLPQLLLENEPLLAAALSL